MEACKVRKGSLVLIEGVRVRITKREKKGSRRVKLRFEDCGNGLPVGLFCGSWLPIQEQTLDLDAQIQEAQVCQDCMRFLANDRDNDRPCPDSCAHCDALCWRDFNFDCSLPRTSPR